jgi:hypothetical protein
MTRNSPPPTTTTTMALAVAFAFVVATIVLPQMGRIMYSWLDLGPDDSLQMLFVTDSPVPSLVTRQR